MPTFRVIVQETSGRQVTKCVSAANIKQAIDKTPNAIAAQRGPPKKPNRRR